MKYSIIVPVYNRPDEVDELLQSLTEQTFNDMEVIIVEDGSSQPCENIVHRYAGKLQLRYYTKENSGPGQTRNFGAEHSQGEYLIFLDSDCVLPPDFLKAVDEELKRKDCDAWGGPDRAHASFTNVCFLSNSYVFRLCKDLRSDRFKRMKNTGIRPKKTKHQKAL